MPIVSLYRTNLGKRLATPIRTIHYCLTVGDHILWNA